MTLKKPNIAIVADWLTTMGGGEQVVMAFSELYPHAPVYTSIYNGNFPRLANCDIRTTWLQSLPAYLRRKHQFLLPFLPHAFSHLDLSNFDIILSSSSAFSKCVQKTRKDQIHICYCHTPTRFLYHARQEYLESYPLPGFLKPFKLLLPKLLDYLTKADQNAADQVDYFICNSDYIRARIDKYYLRKAHKIYPCVDTTRFDSVNKTGNYFLALGRFIPYKKFDLLIHAFAQNELPLKLAGTGPNLAKCKLLAQSLSAKNIEFLDFVADEKLPNLYASARAFLFPAEEDFGLTPVEAMACGVPVIAYGRGGATESVTPQTGILFAEQTVASLQKAIDKFQQIEDEFSKSDIIDNAARFDKAKFQNKISEFILSLPT